MTTVKLPFPDNNYWREALLRAVVAAWDSPWDAITSLRRCYDPDDNFYFETHEHRYFIKVRALTPDLIKGLFEIHDKAMADHLQRRELCLHSGINKVGCG